MAELKKIPVEGIAHALELAERYRLLNDPVQAESICRDVVAVDPSNQVALRSLVLTLTDQFGTSGASAAAREAHLHIAELTDAYERTYYTGIVFERETRAYLLQRNVVRSDAYNGFRHAMEWYERAQELHPEKVDPVLRWNSCARTIDHERLVAAADVDRELPLE